MGRSHLAETIRTYNTEAPTSHTKPAAGANAFSVGQLIANNGELPFLTPFVRCSKSHTVKVWGADGAVKPATLASMRLLATISGGENNWATSGGQPRPGPLGVYVRVCTWLFIEVTNNDSGAAADLQIDGQLHTAE